VKDTLTTLSSRVAIRKTAVYALPAAEIRVPVPAVLATLVRRRRATKEIDS